MRISDWRSDVCSSDLTRAEGDLAMGDLYRVSGDSERALQYYRNSSRAPAMRVRAHIGAAQTYAARGQHDMAAKEFQLALHLSPGDPVVLAHIGRPSCRERVCPYVLISVVAAYV